MRLLLWYCDRFACDPSMKTLDDAPEATPMACEKSVVAFIHVEPSGRVQAGSSAETKLVKNTKWLARKWETLQIVLHSFTHLGEQKGGTGGRQGTHGPGTGAVGRRPGTRRSRRLTVISTIFPWMRRDIPWRGFTRNFNFEPGIRFMENRFGPEYASPGRSCGIYSQIPGRLLLRDRSIRGERRSRGCENLSLPGLPETARRPHAVGRHLSQTPCKVYRGLGSPSVFQWRTEPS